MCHVIQTGSMVSRGHLWPAPLAAAQAINLLLPLPLVEEVKVQQSQPPTTMNKLLFASFLLLLLLPSGAAAAAMAKECCSFGTDQ
jgi:hypothetical protein